MGGTLLYCCEVGVTAGGRGGASTSGNTMVQCDKVAVDGEAAGGGQGRNGSGERAAGVCLTSSGGTLSDKRSKRASEQDVGSYVGVMVVSVCGGWVEARQAGYFPERGTVTCWRVPHPVRPPPSDDWVQAVWAG